MLGRSDGSDARPVLDLQSLRYHPATSPEPVLRDICLTLAAGEPALVAGRSGSGKTTLLELISGLAEPDGGRVLSGSVECEYGWCARDSSVPAREPAAAALGYCTRPCDPNGACPDGLRCELHVVGPSEAVGVCVR